MGRDYKKTLEECKKDKGIHFFDLSNYHVEMFQDFICVLMRMQVDGKISIATLGKYCHGEIAFSCPWTWKTISTKLFPIECVCQGKTLCFLSVMEEYFSVYQYTLLVFV